MRQFFLICVLISCSISHGVVSFFGCFWLLFSFFFFVQVLPPESFTHAIQRCKQMSISPRDGWYAMGHGRTAALSGTATSYQFT